MSRKFAYPITLSFVVLFLLSGINIPGTDRNEFASGQTIEYMFDLDRDSIDDDINHNSDFPLWTFVHAAPGYDTPELKAGLLRTGCDVDRALRYVPVVVSAFDDLDQVRRAARLPAVGVIEKDCEVHFAINISSKAVKAASSNEYFPNTAHDLGYDGEGMTVAILDLGIDNEHPTLNGSFVAGADFSIPDTPATPRDGSFDPDDTGGHGTGVASVLAGRGNVRGEHVGIAPGAGIIDLKLTGLNPAYGRAMADAMEWCIDHKDTDWGNGHVGIDVISMSALSDTTPNSTLGQLQDRIAREGIPFIQAAGNDGVKQGEQPADYWWSDDVIIAGGLDDKRTVDRDDDTYWNDATYGPREPDGDDDLYDELKPDVVAPATNLSVARYSALSALQPARGWHAVEGTSYATPHVSGIVTLMMEANPDIAAIGGKEVLGTLRKLLHDTAEARGEPYDLNLSDKYSARYGFGMVDAHEAVKAARDFEYVNEPPVVESFTADPDEVEKGEESIITATATDPEGDELTYELSAEAGELTGTGPQWTWKAPDDVGRYELTLIVSDGRGNTDMASLSVTVVDDGGPVEPENHPPDIKSFTSSEDTVVTGGTVDLTVIAQDPDADVMEYEYTFTMGQVSGSGNFVQYVAPAIPGTARVTVVVSDGRGGTDTASLDITVVAQAEERPPTIESVELDPESITEGDPGARVLLVVRVERTSDDLRKVVADLSELNKESTTTLDLDEDRSNEDGTFLFYVEEMVGLEDLTPGRYDIVVTAEDKKGRDAEPMTGTLRVIADTSGKETDEAKDEGNNMNIYIIGGIALLLLIVIIALVLGRRG